MSTSNRQNSLLVAEDWKKVYQTFREADFQSYDFETIRKAQIDYLRLYYPEDFNDFVESSEYIALIDLIAFMGQSLAFRTDLNARENFLDTAERRDSVLKLARLVSYTPKRSVPASGVLKFDSVSTTETIVDSNGVNVANTSISWNDATNDNWLEQFTLVLNATFLNSQVIGKPGNSQVINGVRNEEYTVNITSGTVPVFKFDASVNGINYPFEAVSVSSMGQPYLYEVEPRPISKFNILYRNDNQGNSSNNTGFFLFFKQGQMQTVDFKLGEAIPNRVMGVSYNNINNTDIWVYDLTSSNVEDALWKYTPAIAGVNVVYNKSVERKLYQVNTRSGDQIDLVFGDGAFAKVPQGNFRVYFRTGNNQTYKITPDEMQGIAISINYVTREGNIETLTVRASLHYTVTNASANETLNDIRQKAPQQYYAQGRMITGEDYNIIPYTSFSNVVKVKAVNRTSSGISRYLDVNDSSGKYSSTNIFAEDGYLYKYEELSKKRFSYITTSNVQQMVQDDLITILNSKEMQHYIYDEENFPRFTMTNTTYWELGTVSTNNSTGYLYTINSSTGAKQTLQVGYISGNNEKYIRAGAIIKFSAGAGKYFNAQNQIITGSPSINGDKLYIYSSVMQVIGDGTNGGAGFFENGTGPITLTQKIPTGSVIEQIIPVLKTSISAAKMAEIAARVLAYNNFVLQYDIYLEEWVIIVDTQAGTPAPSWLVRFEYTPNIGYDIYWRSLNYYFESKLETKFLFDDKIKIYDSKSSTVIRDQIKVLKVNNQPDSTAQLGIDYTWYVHQNIVESDGYENQSKVKVTFTDTNVDGIPDNPDIYSLIVTADELRNKVFFRREITFNSFESWIPIDSQNNNYFHTEYALLSDITLAIDDHVVGDVFFAYNEDNPDSESGKGIFYILAAPNNVKTLVETTEYQWRYGRENLYFQYRHNSPGYRRIDPSPNNLIDIFLLVSSYATDYQNWLRDTTDTIEEPLPPSTDQLKLEYGSLDTVKAISDTIIFNSARFKPLFGDKSAESLRAVFKVVKNSTLNISDNEIKSSVINAINTYFSIDNWDFGETFYFSELSAYLHTTLSPNVASIIIVPVDPKSMFGSLYQINAEANEILTSSATVDDVEIISAITAAAINANFAGVNTMVTLGNN